MSLGKRQLKIGKNVLITAGKQDPMCPPDESEELHELLQNAGAEVKTFWIDSGAAALNSSKL